MKRLVWLILAILLITVLASCNVFRAENPLNIKCASCGYIWDRSVDHTTEQQLPGQLR